MLKKKRLEKIKECPNCKKIREETWDEVLKYKKEMNEMGKWLVKESPKGYCGISEKDGCRWLTTGSFAVKKDMDSFEIQSRPESGSDYVVGVSQGDLGEFIDFLMGDYEIIYDKNHKYQLVITKHGVIQLAELIDKNPRTIKMFQSSQKNEAFKMLEELSEKPLNPNAENSHKKPRFLLEVIDGMPLALVDVREYPAKVIKRYPPEQLEEAKKELFRLGKEDEEEQRKKQELAEK